MREGASLPYIPRVLVPQEAMPVMPSQIPEVPRAYLIGARIGAGIIFDTDIKKKLTGNPV